MLFWKTLVSLLVALPLYGCMVTAFHLLNLPSDRAVLGACACCYLSPQVDFLRFETFGGC
jgi:hypothetical protein